jgi:hypothetical protein
MTMIETIARAWDAEEAAQCGEPSPWDIGREDDGFVIWRNTRLAMAKAALLALAKAELSEGQIRAANEAPRGLERFRAILRAATEEEG